MSALAVPFLALMMLFQTGTADALAAEKASSSAEELTDATVGNAGGDINTGESSVDEMLSFYQKLAEGQDVSILIIGDSIGTGAGASSEETMWFHLLTESLAETYYNEGEEAEETGDSEATDGVSASGEEETGHIILTNACMSGNDSYAGYVTAMTYEDGIDYDLVILCYGQNDSASEFAVYYEAMIRAVKTKYPGASILSILESSQLEYTEKILKTMELCSWYGIPVVDTIAAFDSSGYSLSELTSDGLHPSDLGYELYALYAELVIEANVEAGTGIVAMPEPYDEAVLEYENFRFYPAGNAYSDSTERFVRVSNTSYTLTVHEEGTFGIYYSYNVGDTVPDIWIDGVLCSKPIVLYEYDFPDGIIQVFGKDCMIQEEITLVFATKEEADGFYGMCVSW